ncbi:ABC transporter permease [Micromonospora aurantiaca]|uniref:ABC transporter permease n=2 Tax=Micromonospora TaxID=1873 RepID=A0A1C6THW3_9ACTN|nr:MULTISPECIES: ABC transporter permease [Micromonospora]ADL48913.1 binding-protein-dependent transport systems inner membrane component [Micromonospora aurantiaca ATCC 27029]ADU06050.1 binding-protein-dependent transport systems inner membrane component [Micromonospora sp. L5]AXH89081.1 ABC transporter permease [Micromonospora aurantiaca]AXO36683.1 oligopeptide transport system permease protein OppB [Micromonospora sp. B006]EWM67567.1 peptide ABC transporter permease [Micromonospora sp. M42]
MGRYLLRRLLQLVPVFIGTTFLIYWLVWSVPGDPFAGKCGDRGCPPNYRAMMTEKYNLDESIWVQYASYMKNLLQGDFGITFGGREISDIIATSYPNTLKLAVVALAIEAVIGLGAGILTGLRRNGFLDNLVLVSTLFLIALPVFVIGFVLQWLLGVKWGIINPTVSNEMRFSELIVPGFVLGSASMAYIARVARTSIAENRRADYVRTAIAKGLPMRRVVGVHLLRNSLIPVVTLLGTDLGALMGGAIVTEGIFGINGIGRQVLRSIVTKESATVVGIVVVLVLVYLIMNLVVDLLYAALDPRIRYE